MSQLDSKRSPTPPRVAAPSHTISIAVFDACPDGRLLLAATLYGLGCRCLPLDCESDTPESLRAQLVASRPDVVVWQLGSAPHNQCTALLGMLGSGALALSGVVVTTPFPLQVVEALGDSASRVRVLATPFSLVDLIGTVGAAQRDYEGATHL